jgi:hypothetical protein
MKNLLILIIPFLILSCGSDNETMKEKRAVALYDRISEMVHGSGSSADFTTEWKAICQKIFDGKDTVFMMNNGDFQILITTRHDIISDTTPIAKTPATVQDSSKNTWK